MSASENLSNGPNSQPEVLDQIEAESPVEPQESEQISYEHVSLNSGGSNGNTQPRRGKHDRKAMRRFLFVFDLCLVWGSAGAVVLLPAYGRSEKPAMAEPLLPPGSDGF